MMILIYNIKSLAHRLYWRVHVARDIFYSPSHWRSFVTRVYFKFIPIIALLLFTQPETNSQCLNGTTVGDTTVCALDNSGIISVTGYTGNVINWQYSTPGSSNWQVILNSANDTFVFNNLSETTLFRANVKDLNPCFSDTLQVTINPKPNVKFYANNSCVFDSVEFVNTSNNDTIPVSFTWDFGDGNTSNNENPKYAYQNNGDYSILLTGETNNNCIDSLRNPIVIHPLPQVGITNDTSISKGDVFELMATGGVTYEWFPQTALDDPFIPNPMANPVEPMTYEVSVTDANGCNNSASVNISMDIDFKVTPYNAITPNNDGYNDTWIIKNIENYPDNKVFVFDRQGKLVYEKQNYTNDWTGRNLKGDILPDGSYFFMLQLGNGEKDYRGTVTIFR